MENFTAASCDTQAITPPPQGQVPDSLLERPAIRMEGIFGQTIFHITYPEAVAAKLVPPVRVIWRKVATGTHDISRKDGVPRKRWGVWQNTARNQIIAEAALSHGDAQVLVMVRFVEHAIYLLQHLPGYTLVHGKRDQAAMAKYLRTGLLPDDYPHMDGPRLEGLKVEFERGHLRHVIATGVWSVGVDFTNLQILVRAEVDESAIGDIQEPGRVTRLADGKEYGIVRDFLDEFDKTWSRNARRRMARYRELGWEQFLETPQGLEPLR
jgi:superfamily II DNA or RNA helicase